MPSNGQDLIAYRVTSWSLRDLLTTVFKRRLLILVFATSVVSLVLGVTLVLPRTYEVESILLVKKARADVPLAPTDSRQLVIDELSEQDLNSEIQILKSRTLIEEVLQSLGVDESWRQQDLAARVLTRLKRALGAPKLSYFEEMTIQLERTLDVYPVRRSKVIRISYRSHDPDWATAIVRTLTDRYLEYRAQMFQSPQAVSFFEDQATEAKQRLDDLERQIQEYLEEAGITMVQGPEGADSLAAQKAIVMEGLVRCQNGFGDAEAYLQEQSKRMSELQERLETEPERFVSSNQQNQDPTVLELERTMAQLELERDALLLEFKPDSRPIRDINVQIELVQHRLDASQQRVGEINRTEVNPIHQQLKADYLRAEVEFGAAQARIASLREQVVESQRQLDTLNARGFELERLRREAKAAESNYLLYLRKHEEARISAAMDQRKLINVTVAQAAGNPLEPLPRGLLNKIPIAFLVGIAGGLGLAFGLETYIDHSFTNGDDLESRLGINHVASIPDGATGV